MAESQTRRLTLFDVFVRTWLVFMLIWCSGMALGVWYERRATCREVRKAFEIAPNTDALLTLRALDLCQ